MYGLLNYLVSGVLIIILFKSVFKIKSNDINGTNKSKHKNIKSNRENMKFTKKNLINAMNDLSNQIPRENLFDDNSDSDSDSDNGNITIEENCHTNNTIKNMDKFIKNKLFDEIHKCDNFNSDSKVDDCSYKNNFFSFHNKINGSSRNNPDPVDKVNLYKFNGAECGTKIKDIYDGLTTY